MKMIDAEALIEDLEYDIELDQRALDNGDIDHSEREIWQFDKDCKQNAVYLLKKAPTVDAVPVRHGTWIPCAKNGLVITELMRKEGRRWYGFKCSACNYIRKGNALTEAIYCEHCGARMDGEEE